MNLASMSEDGDPILDGADFGVTLPAHVAIVGPAGSGKEELTLVLANLIAPDAGRVLVGDREIQKLAEVDDRPRDDLCRLSGPDLRRDDRRQSAVRPQAPAPAGGRA